jgi:hypothetical protein
MVAAILVTVVGGEADGSGRTDIASLRGSVKPHRNRDHASSVGARGRADLCARQ